VSNGNASSGYPYRTVSSGTLARTGSPLDRQILVGAALVAVGALAMGIRRRWTVRTR
jgi:hypothetical protein